jgi:hypothetical protein
MEDIPFDSKDTKLFQKEKLRNKQAVLYQYMTG